MRWMGLVLLPMAMMRGQTAELPAGWQTVPLGGGGSPAAINCRDYASDHAQRWSVEANGGTIAIKPESREPEVTFPDGIERVAAMKGRLSKLEVSDGWLLGFDAEEFGGGLWFAQRGKPAVKFSEETIHGFVKGGTKIFAFAGLAHLDIDEGSLLRVDRGASGSWSATVVDDLRTAPGPSVTAPDGMVFLATSNRLLRIDGEGHVRELDPLPIYLTKTSIARTADGSLYIGMRFLVLRFTPVGDRFRPEALVPVSCRHFAQHAVGVGDAKEVHCGCE